MVWGEVTTVSGPAGNPAASGDVESRIVIWLSVDVVPLSGRKPHASWLDASQSIAGIARFLNLLTGGAFGSFGSANSTVPDPRLEDSIIKSVPAAVEPSSGTAEPCARTTAKPRPWRWAWIAWSPAKVNGPGSAVTK